MFRVLASVSDKTGLTKFLEGVQRYYGSDLQIISTGGTYDDLSAAKLPVMKVQSVTGVPEAMDGRVKTLHHKIFAGILARRRVPADMKSLTEDFRSGEIHMVIVNFYPFEKTAATPGATFAQLVEKIDIGGPSLVRAAAKNFQDVIVLVDPDDYEPVLMQIERMGAVLPGTRYELMRKAFSATAQYDAAISGELACRHSEGVERALA